MSIRILDSFKIGAKVGFFGLGQSNSALLRCLPLDSCSVTLRSDSAIDRSAIPGGIKIDRIFEGINACRDINEDIIVFSPSVRRDRAEFLRAQKTGTIFTSDLEIFIEENHKPMFAVTGSDGKSTTAALIEHLLNEGGTRAFSVGNMGEPMVSRLSDAADFYVAELSSFMLTYAIPKTKRACLTNITPNHLDWHIDFEEYKKTKISLIKNCEEFVISDDFTDIPGGFGVISTEKGFEDLKKQYQAEVYMTVENGYICRNGERLIPICDIQRRESHNIKNLMMATAMTDGYVGKNEIINVAKSFSGLPHRCECFFSDNGIDYFNSSIDTSPARTAATLSSLGRRAVVILGGKSKGLDYREMIPALKSYAAAVVIVGENSHELYSALSGEIECHIAEDFKSAIRLGATLARDAGALILSPASASYDSFKNYEERGNEFKKQVLKTRIL